MAWAAHNLRRPSFARLSHIDAEFALQSMSVTGSNTFFPTMGSDVIWLEAMEVYPESATAHSTGRVYELFGELRPDQLLDLNEEGITSRERVLSSKVAFRGLTNEVGAKMDALARANCHLLLAAGGGNP
jgi:hypothetical protein